MGDAFCLIASILYALSNVGAEYFIRENSKREYLAMMGVFGMLISCVQMLVVTKHFLRILNSSYCFDIILSVNSIDLLFLFLSR